MSVEVVLKVRGEVDDAQVKALETRLQGLGPILARVFDSGAIDRAKDSLSGMESKLGTVGEATTRAADKTDSWLTKLTKIGLGVFGITQVKNALVGAGAALSGLIAGNAQFETFETQFATLLKGPQTYEVGVERAKAKMDELADFAAKTPFELPQIAAAEKVLLGFGLTGTNVQQKFGMDLAALRTSVGDMAAGTGVDFAELANTWGRFASGDAGQAIMRLQELGIVTKEQLRAAGVEFSKSGQMVSPLPEALQAAMKIANDKFGGGMANLSATFEGQVSTLSDNWAGIKRTFAAPIFDAMKSGVEGLNSVLGGEGFQATVKRVAEIVGGSLATGIAFVRQQFDTWSQGGGMDRLKVVLTNIAAGLLLFLQTARAVGTWIVEHKELIAGFAAAWGVFAIAAGIANVQAWLLAGGIAATLAPILAISLPLLALAAIVGLVVANWGTVGPWLAGVFDNIKAAAGALIDYWTAIFTGDWTAALQSAKDFLTSIFGPGAAEALDSLIATVVGWKDTVVTTFHDLVEAVQMKASSLWAGLVGLFVGGVTSVLEVAHSLWEGLLTTWESIRVAVSGTVSGLWEWLQETWTSGVAFVSGIVAGMAENLRAAWSWISTTVSTIVARLINWLRTSWGTAGTWLAGLLTRVATMFRTAWAWIRDTVGGIVTRLVNAVVGALRWLGEKASIIWEKVQDLFSDAWTGIMGIFKGAAGGLVRGVGALFSKIAELAGKGMAAVGGVISKIFTAIITKVKGLLGALGVDLGSIFSFGGSDDGQGFFENLASGFSKGIESLMGGIGSIMQWFETKWGDAKKKLQGFFAEKDELKDQAEKDQGGDPNLKDPNAGSGTDISGLAGGGSASAAKAYTAPDGMSGREADGSEWYIDPATGKKIYTSGPKKNQQDARERGAEAKAANKGAKGGKGGTGEGSEDPAVSAARTAAETAAKISEALQKAANTLRELGRTELPGESVWAPKIAAIEVFIQASLDSFDRLAMGLLDKIGQTEDGAELLDTAKGKAISAVSSLTGGMVDSMTKVSTFLQGLVKAKWPSQDQIDVAFGLIGDALVRVQTKSLELAEKVGAGSGGEGAKSPAEHLAAAGTAIGGWIDSHIKAAQLLDVLAKVKVAPAGALEAVQGTLRKVGEIMASLLSGPGYDLTEDPEKTATQLVVSRDVQATLSSGIDLLTKLSAAGEQIARIRPIPESAWANTRAIMLAASMALYALIAGDGYDNTKDPERTAIVQTVSRDTQATMASGLDLLSKLSAAGRSIAKTPPVPEAAWANAKDTLERTARILYELGGPLLKDTETSTKQLAVSQSLIGVLGSGVTLIGQLSDAGTRLAKIEPWPADALARVDGLLTGSVGMLYVFAKPLLADTEKAGRDLALVGQLIKVLSDSVSLVAQTATVGDMLAKSKPFDVAAADLALQNARAGLTAVERFATEYAASFTDTTVTVEDRLAQVQQYAAALREALGLIDAAGKFKLGRVLPVDAVDVDQAVKNAKLAFERLHFWSQAFEQGMAASGFDVDEVIESVKRYSAALRDAVSLVETAGKLKLEGVLPLSAADVNTAVINAQLTFDRLHFWAQTMAGRLEASGFDVATVFEQVKAYTAALKEALSLVEAAGKFALSDIVLVDPIDVDRAVQNADVALRLVTDWARAWHASLEGQKLVAEDVLAEISTYSKVIKEALDLVNAAVGLTFEDSLPINEAGVRQGLQNADTALRLVEEFAASWRARFTTLEGELGAAQLRTQAEEIELYTKAAGSALDLIARAATLVVDTVAPLDPSLVTASLDKARVVLDQVESAAADWAKSIRDSGRNLQEVSSETEAFQKGAAGSFDLLLKVHEFIDKVTSPRILEPLAKGAKHVPAKAIEETLAELTRVVSMVMTSLGDIYDDPKVAASVPKAERLAGIIAPAADALVKVLDMFSMDRLLSSPLVNMKLGSDFATGTRSRRLDQLAKQITEGVKRTVQALIDGLKDIVVPTNLDSGLDRVVAAYERIVAILERVRDLATPDPAKIREIAAMTALLVAGLDQVAGTGSGSGLPGGSGSGGGGIASLVINSRETLIPDAKIGNLTLILDVRIGDTSLPDVIVKAFQKDRQGLRELTRLQDEERGGRP